MKNLKIKFSIWELIIVVGLFFIAGCYTPLLMDKIENGDPIFGVLCMIIGDLLVAGSVILRCRVKIVEVKTEI